MGETTTKKSCKGCGEAIKGRAGNAQFCSPSCRTRFYRKGQKLNTEMECGICGTPFVRVTSQKYCSKECSHEANKASKRASRAERLTCEACGEPFDGFARRRFCESCKYDTRRTRVGTQRMTAEGYVLVRVPGGTKNSRGDREWMLEHRYVMQEYLGRPLQSNETVHHINGDKTDNRPVNLQLRFGNHGKHTRFVCADCGSFNVEQTEL